MSSIFGQMRPLVSMATARVTVGKTVSSRFSNVFDWIYFILASKDDIHKILNEFEIRRDPTMDYGVGCPLASEKLIMEKMTSSHFLCYFSSGPFRSCR